MKVLVTGATGGLGKLIVNELLKHNIEVVATFRDIEKGRKMFKNSPVKLIPFTISKGSDKNLYEFFEKPDLTIHLAWENLNDFRAEQHLSTTLSDHKAFLENLISNGLKSIVVSGTCYEYGLKEGVLEETMDSYPVLPYAEAKNQLRVFLEELKNTYSFSLMWLRIFYVFGEVEGRKNLYTLLQTAINNNEKEFNMSGGQQVRDFLSPIEIATNFVLVAMQNEVEGIINCCSGKPIKLIDRVNAFLIEKKANIKLNLGYYPYPDYEPMETWGSTEKLKKAISAKKILNFKPY